MSDDGAGARTWTPGELHEAIDGLLEHVFGPVVWVEGELADLSRSSRGHVYFRLVEADGDRPDRRPSLSVTLFDSERRSVNRFLRAEGDPIRMADGIRVRIGGRLTTYASRSTIQLVMDRIDPAFTLGLIGQERIRLLAALGAEGLLERNASLPFPPVPLHVGVVTSIGSAAHADAVDELRRSGLGFRVSVFDARTQGLDAVTSVVSAVRSAAMVGVDLVLVVRGGGATTDLVAFDDESVARAIATCPVPVVTGIGHEVDSTVADAVAHTAHKTPTAAAAAAVDAVRTAERRIDGDWNAVCDGATACTARAQDRLARVGHRTGAAATSRLDRRRGVVDAHGARTGAAARGHLRVATTTLAALADRRRPAADRILERSGDRLSVLAARSSAHDPALALRRGWSVTRTADGRLIRSTVDADPDEEIVTTLTDGTVRSRVLGDAGGSRP